MKAWAQTTLVFMMVRSCLGFRAGLMHPRRARLSFSTAAAAASRRMPDDTFSVAPMMDYTDRHLRYLLRLVSKRATLYTEMVRGMARRNVMP